MADSPKNPHHRARWRKLFYENRVKSREPLKLAGIHRGTIITEQYIRGKWVGQSTSPLTLPRVRFLEGEDDG